MGRGVGWRRNHAQRRGLWSRKRLCGGGSRASRLKERKKWGPRRVGGW